MNLASVDKLLHIFCYVALPVCHGAQHTPWLHHCSHTEQLLAYHHHHSILWRGSFLYVSSSLLMLVTPALYIIYATALAFHAVTTVLSSNPASSRLVYMADTATLQ
jgi:hypothetical protein